MNLIKSVLQLYEHPLLNYMAQVKRLQVVKTPSQMANEYHRLQFRILDEDDNSHLHAQGSSFCCLRVRHFELEIRDFLRNLQATMEKDTGVPNVDCCCRVLCPNSSSIVLLSYGQRMTLGSVRENCSTLWSSYSLVDESGRVLGRLRGPLIVSGLVGVGQLAWLQPRVRFSLLEGSSGSREIGSVTRQMGFEAYETLDRYEIEFWDGAQEPHLRLLVLFATFMIENRFFESANCDLFNCNNYDNFT